MAGIPKTTEVRSISKYGLSVVTVVFEDGTDIYFARQLRERAHARGAARRSRRDTAAPRWGRSATGLGEIFQFVVRNESMTLMQLEELLDWQIAPAAAHGAAASSR